MSKGKLYYFGCWGSVGHYLRDCQARTIGDSVVPFAHLDGVHCPGATLIRGRWETPLGAQDQGHAALLHAHGWIVLGIWDRTLDSRYGSHSTFLYDGAHDNRAMLRDELMTLCERRYPAVWARILKAGPIIVVDVRSEQHPAAALRGKTDP